MSIEGVNMEEEMVNLMAFQKYFVANSKAITTMNEVFDSLFSIISITRGRNEAPFFMCREEGPALDRGGQCLLVDQAM